MFWAPGMSAGARARRRRALHVLRCGNLPCARTLLPWRTARAPPPDVVGDVVQRAEFVAAAHRPQFDSVWKYPSTSSCVGIGRAVIPASTPAVTRLEASPEVDGVPPFRPHVVAMLLDSVCSVALT